MKLQKPSKHYSLYDVISGFIIGLPLVFVPFNPELNKPFRWGFMVTIFIVCFAVAALRSEVVKSYKKLSVAPRIALLILASGIIISTVFAKTPLATKIIGLESEYLGALTWLSFLVIALVARSHIASFFQKKAALVIASAVLIVSLISNNLLIWYGYRLTGLLQQATSMGMYSVLVLLLATWNLMFTAPSKTYRGFLYFINCLAIAGILLSQSRLALGAGISMCLLLMLAHYFKSKRLHFATIVFLILMVFTPVAAKGYFDRLRTEQVADGFSYRWDVYQASLSDVQASNYLTGYGASGLPETINSPNKAPDGVIESLDKGFVFLSAHDIFLDIMLGFGVLAGLGFIFLILNVLKNLVDNPFAPEKILVVGLFVMLLLNGVFNVPSMEMTLLLFVLIISLQPDSGKSSKAKI